MSAFSLPQTLRIASGLMPWFLENLTDRSGADGEPYWDHGTYERAARCSLDAAEMLLKVYAERQP